MTRDEQLIKAALDMAAATCEKSAYAADADGHHFAYSIRAIDAYEVLAKVGPDPAPDPALFQDRVAPWMQECFGAEISADRLERSDRLLEEVLELLQSGNYPPERIATLTKYVWSRALGEPAQEVGGVMVTLAAYCLAHGLNMHAAGETELERIWTKVEKIRAKQAAKPKGSALPQEWAEPAHDAVARLVQAGLALQPYLDWTIGPESPGYHPTMASAVAAFKAALAEMETNHDH